MFLVVYDGCCSGYGYEVYAAGIFSTLSDAEKCRVNVIEKCKTLTPEEFEDWDEDDLACIAKIIEIKPDIEYDIKKGHFDLETELYLGGHTE